MVIRIGEVVRVSYRTNLDGKGMCAKVVSFARFEDSVHVERMAVQWVHLQSANKLMGNGNTSSKGTI